MKRRGFLKLLGLAPVVGAAVVLTKTETPFDKMKHAKKLVNPPVIGSTSFGTITPDMLREYNQLLNQRIRENMDRVMISALKAG